MELDLTHSPLDLKKITPLELEEVLEDPFAIRFLPDSERADGLVRYYCLGRTVQDRLIFLNFWTNGKLARIIAARDMTDSETRFYLRHFAELK